MERYIVLLLLSVLVEYKHELIRGLYIFHHCGNKNIQPIN